LSKLGFKFAAVPRERHPEWFEVSLDARCLGLELFVTIYDEKARVAEVAVTERWAISLCKLLRVEVEDRRAACRMLEAMERRGLLVIEHGKARLVFRADEQLGPRKPDPRKSKETSDVGQCDVNAGSEWGQSGVNRTPTIGNDSTHVLQREEIEERERDARARETQTRAEPTAPPELLPKPPELDPTFVRLGKIYQALYNQEQEGTRNPREYDEQRITSCDARQFISLVELVRVESKRTDVGQRALFEAAARAFLRDPKQRTKGHVLEFFVRDFAHWAEHAADGCIEAAS